MDRELAELRRAVADLGPKRAGRRVPEQLRNRIVAVVSKRQTSGENLSTLGAALGLAPETLSRWLAAGPHAATAAGQSVIRPLPVVIASGPATATAGLTLITPTGHRLEGLTVATAAELLGRLR